MHEARRLFALSGQHFSAPAARGTRTAQACSSLTGGEFFAEIQRGDSPSADGGTSRRPPQGQRRTHGGGQKGRDTCGFPSSLNSCLSLIRKSGADCRHVTAPKWGTAEDFFYRVFRTLFAVSDTGLLHIRATLRWVRHNSAAQFDSAL